MLWSIGAGAGAGAIIGAVVRAGAGAGAGLIEGLPEENAKGAEKTSEVGLGAKEKLEDPEPKTVDPPREKADGDEELPVLGTEKIKPDDEDDTGAVGTMLNGATEEEAAVAGGVEAAAEERLRFGNVAGPDGMEAAVLGGLTAKEPVNRKNCFNLISF